MKLHPRTQPVNAAEADIRMALIDAQDYHRLTDVEMLRFLITETERVSKRLLRAERHPDNPDRKGDEACDGMCRHDLPEPPTRCTGCGRGARKLEPVFEDVDGVNQIVGWLGPSCYRRHLDVLREAAMDGQVCQLITVPLGGAR